MKAGTTASKRRQLRLETLEERILLVGPLLPDAYEPNDSFGTATPLGVVLTTTVVPALTIDTVSDEDYFAFTLGEDAGVWDYVEVEFEDVEGNLDLELYNNLFELVQEANTTSDNETISLSGVAAGTYYARVFGPDADINSYELTIGIPTTINPGDAAVLTDGNLLFFIQGEDEEDPSDGPGAINEDWIVIGSFTGAGRVEFLDSLGNPTLENGSKIGDMELYDVDGSSNLTLERGMFREGFDVDDAAAVLENQPDEIGEALEIVVPEGEVGVAAEYNTGRLIVSASGEDEDWYTFTASEGETINTSWTGAGNIRIWLQPASGAPSAEAFNTYDINDDWPDDDASSDVTVYLEVPGNSGVPYAMLVDRVKRDFDWDDPPDSDDQVTAAEDFPEDAEAALDISWADDSQTGLGAATPPFTLTGDGPGLSGHDFFTFTLGIGQTVLGSAFSVTTSSVDLRDPDDSAVLGDLVADGSYQNDSGADLVVTMDVVSNGAWSFDIEIEAPLLSEIVERVDDEEAWAGTMPWMNGDAGTGTDYFAPEDSGVVAVTGDVHFLDDVGASTGFGEFTLYGSLKGSFGTAIDTMEQGENIRGITVGFINGWEGVTVGGVYTEGSLDQLLVRTTVGEITEADVDGGADIFSPADIHVGEYLLNFHSSGTVFADITVDGLYGGAPPDLTFVDTEAELDSDDTQAGATIVGAPSGSFTIAGDVGEEAAGEPGEDVDWVDPQDWYVFTPGLGNEITIEIADLGSLLWPDYAQPVAWVFSPSGRLIAPVTEAFPAEFVADEGGQYHIMVGSPETDTGTWDNWPLFEDQGLVEDNYRSRYEISVSGAMGVDLGGLVVGSDVLGNADTSNGLEFGDDVSSTQVEANNVGFIDVMGDGSYENVTLDAAGNVGFVTAANMGSSDGFATNFYADFDIGGNFDRLETRTGDMQFSALIVSGYLGEMQSAGFLGSESTDPSPPLIEIDGAAGAVIAAEDFLAQMVLNGAGLDLLYVGGDFGAFGTTVAESASVDAEVGGDVAFAYVEGDIYEDGLEVFPVILEDGESFLFTDDGGATFRLAPGSGEAGGEGSLEFRFLPVGRVGGWPVGAVITEIDATDSLSIRLLGGLADLGYVRMGDNDFSYLEVTSSEPLAELDIYFVDTKGETVETIANRTSSGDIVNMRARHVDEVIAYGHVGMTDRFLPMGGRLPNPTPDTFSPMTMDVATSDALLDFVFEEDPRYFNGILADRSINVLTAYGSIGDVYSQRHLRDVRADANGVVDGRAFSFRGVYHDDLTWDGLAGVAVAERDIEYIDPGSGLLGGSGDKPIAGVFAISEIEVFAPSSATISGPVFGAEGIGLIQGSAVPFTESTIGAGADFSDWRWWDGARTQGNQELGRVLLTGAGSGFRDTIIQVGVLGEMLIDVGGFGIDDSWLWAGGDPVTEEGIGEITVRGGGIDGSDTPLWGFIPAISTNQNIGTIELTGPGVDLSNMNILSLKAIQSIEVQAAIVSDVPGEVMMTTAPLGIGLVSAGELIGGGDLYFGTSMIGEFETTGNSGDVRADVTTDGGVREITINGVMDGGFEVIGSSGFIGEMTINNVLGAAAALSGDVISANYIEEIEVRRGDVTGQIVAGGSDSKNLAIGSIRLRDGDLISDIDVIPNLLSLRPGGGIGRIEVSGQIGGAISTTSYWDPARANAVTANIERIRVRGGDFMGSIGIQKSNPGNPFDPGGDLVKLEIKGGELGDGIVDPGIEVDVDGDILNIRADNPGGVAISADIEATGHIARIRAKGDVTGNIVAGAGLGRFDVGSTFTGSLSITGSLDRVSFKTKGGTAMDGASITVLGNFGRLFAKGHVLDSFITVTGSIGKLGIAGDYTDTSIEAGTLSAVKVKGVISGVGGDDVIHAATGSFTVSDAFNKKVLIVPGSPVDFSGVLASVA